MKSHLSYSSLFILLSIIFLRATDSYAQAIPSELLEWKGTWYTIQKQDTLFERWEIMEDGTLKGESWVIKQNKDSVHSEFLRLYADAQTIIYEPTVKSQHGDKPMPFHMILQTSNYWMFYNEKNDFPKFITYKLISNNQLKAVISNSDNPDKSNSMEFNFTRYK
ncbi:MAG: DUF6265 family protein [Bacteroidia bacterium]